MRMSKRAIRIAGVGLSFALVATACGSDEPTDPTSTPTDGETTPVATGGSFSLNIGEPQGLVPTDANESEGIAVLNALFRGLIEYNHETAEPEFAVAESIETDDNLTFTVKLKDGWTFHNGEAVTAASFVDAWNYAAYAPNAQQNSGFFNAIKGFDAVNPSLPSDAPEDAEAPAPTAETLEGLVVVDDLTFTIELSSASPTFEIQLGYSAFVPLPSVAYEDISAFNEAPVGNGPFEMDGTWEHDVAIKVKAFADYAGDDKPLVDGIEYRIYTDIETAYNDLLAGNLDLMDSLPPTQVEAAKVEFGDRYGQSPSSSFNYLGLPYYVDAYDDVRIRQALSMAIDRKTITDTIFNGSNAPAHGFISPVIPGFRDNACATTTEFNPTKAKELFDAAGGIDGPIVAWFNSGAGHDEWITAVTNMWTQNLGIPADSFSFESLEFADYLGKIDAHELTGPFRLGWGMDYPHPQNYLEPLYSSAAAAPAGSNAAIFENAAFDKAVADGNAQPGLDLGMPFYQAAEDILCEELPVLPMFFGQNKFAWNDTVSNVYVNAFGNIDYTAVAVNS